MKKRIICTLLAAALFIVCILALSGCGETETPGNAPAEPPTTGYTEPQYVSDINIDDYTKNSDTDELLEDFGYLFADIRNDKEAIKNESAEDIVTVFIEEYDGDMCQEWIYDAKRNAVFTEVYPSDPALLETYGRACVLSEAEMNELTSAFDEADTYEWDDNYPGNNIGTGSYSWDIVIEYGDGVLEEHSGHGNDGKMPVGFVNIKNLFYHYNYGDSRTVLTPEDITPTDAGL